MGYKPLFLHLPLPMSLRPHRGIFHLRHKTSLRLLELLSSNINQSLISVTLIRQTNRYAFFEYGIFEKAWCKRWR